MDNRDMDNSDKKPELPPVLNCVKKEPVEDDAFESIIMKQESNQRETNTLASSTPNLNEGPLITKVPVKCEPTETNAENLACKRSSTSNLKNNKEPLIIQTPQEREPTLINTVESAVNAVIILLSKGLNIEITDVNSDEEMPLPDIEASKREVKSNEIISSENDKSSKKNKRSYSETHNLNKIKNNHTLKKSTLNDDNTKENISDLLHPRESKKFKTTYSYRNGKSEGGEMLQITSKKLKIEPVEHSTNDVKISQKKRTFISSKRISDNEEKFQKRLKTEINDEQRRFLVQGNDYFQKNNCTLKASLGNDIPNQNISNKNEDEDQEDDILVLPIIKEQKHVEVLTISDDDEDGMKKIFQEEKNFDVITISDNDSDGIEVFQEESSFGVITTSDDEKDGIKKLQNGSTEVFKFTDSSNGISHAIKGSPVISPIKFVHAPPEISSVHSNDTMEECISASTTVSESRTPEYDLSKVNENFFDNFDRNSEYITEGDNLENAVSLLPVFEKNIEDITCEKNINSRSENHSAFQNIISDKNSLISACFSTPTTSEVHKKENFSTDILSFLNVVNKLDRSDCQIALNYLSEYKTQDTAQKYISRPEQNRKMANQNIKSDAVFTEENVNK